MLARGKGDLMTRACISLARRRTTSLAKLSQRVSRGMGAGMGGGGHANNPTFMFQVRTPRRRTPL